MVWRAGGPHHGSAGEPGFELPEVEGVQQLLGVGRGTGEDFSASFA